MRCWTDGRREVFHANALHIHLDGQPLALQPWPNEDRYGALGGLAVHPTEDVIWICGDRTPTRRFDMVRDTVVDVRQHFADLAYLPDGRLIGVTGGQDGPRRLVRVDDEDGHIVETLDVGFERRVGWPWGLPYQFGVYSQHLDHLASVRLCASASGVAMASTSGHVALVPTDAQPSGWRMPPVYQGWAVATLTAEGVLLSTQHNGRSGDLVWLDRMGRWTDALDSDWDGISPPGALHTGVLCMHRRALHWHLTARDTLASAAFDGRIHDLAVAPDGCHAVFITDHGLGRVRQRPDGGWHVLHNLQTLAEWAPAPPDRLAPAPWTWTTTGEHAPLSVPDEARMAEWEEAFAGAHPDHRVLMLPDLLAELPPHKGDWQAWLNSADPRRVVWAPLIRERAPRAPSRAMMRELLQRYINDASPFVRFVAGGLVFGWGGEPPTVSAETPNALDHIAHGGTWRVPGSAERALVAARLSGELDEHRLTWSLEVTFADGASGVLRPTWLAPRMLTHDDGDTDDVIEGTRSPVPATWVHGTSRQDLELQLWPVPSWCHRAYLRDPSLEEHHLHDACVGRFDVNFVGVQCNAPDPRTAARWLALHVDTAAWFVGGAPSGKGLVLTTFADDLELPTPCGAPRVDPGTLRFIDGLVGEGHLELARPIDDTRDATALLELQWILHAEDTQALADHLIDMDAVADLFADDGILALARASSRDRQSDL